VVENAAYNRGHDHSACCSCRCSHLTGTLDATCASNAITQVALSMRVFWLLALCLSTLQVHAAATETTTQTTTGTCSPAMSHVAGHVTITCQGLDEQALTLLNEFLDKKFAAFLNESRDRRTSERLHELLDKKDLELQVKIREAEEWARKYHELEQRLTIEGQDSPLAQQAQTLLKDGKLEEAGALFDRLIDAEEKGVERAAAHHFNRAEVYALQFQPHKALPHYEKAYYYRPDKVEYAFRYAHMLQEQKSYAQAQPIYERVLNTYRQLAEQNSVAYLPDVAATLHNLALLYSHTQRLSDSEQALQEALTTYRQLAEKNPPAYLRYVATTLNDLAILYRNTHRLADSEQANHEALTIRRQLAQANPQTYLPGVAGTLNDLGNLYRDTQRLSDSEQAYQEALTTYRQLAQANPQAYLPDVAMTLHNLSVLKVDQDDVRQAQTLIAEALTIRRGLWKQHASAYGTALAQSLAVDILLLQRPEDKRTLICARLHEMTTVALQESLKQWAQERMAAMCPSGQYKRIGKSVRPGPVGQRELEDAIPP
jgi:hypothetical protein